MYPRAFDYARAGSIEEALELRSETAGRFLAGGHSLLPLMKLRMTAPETLIDIGRIDELRGISGNGGFSIGALTTHATVASENSAAFPSALREAASMIGDPQVRNRGTVGGNVAHADPASDLPTVFSALGATMTAVSKNGTREIAASDFFTGLFESALGEDELLTRIDLDAESDGTGSGYAKLFNPASRYAVVGVCGVVAVGDDGECTSCTVAVGGLTPHAMIVESVGSEIVGKPVTQDNADKAAQAALDDIGDSVVGDIYAGVEYRRRVLPTFIVRALTQAASRTG